MWVSAPVFLVMQFTGSSTGWGRKAWSASGKTYQWQVLHLSRAGMWAGREGAAVPFRQASASARPGLEETMLMDGSNCGPLALRDHSLNLTASRDTAPYQTPAIYKPQVPGFPYPLSSLAMSWCSHSHVQSDNM